MLKSYEGDKAKLGKPEQFFLQLLDLPKWVVNKVRSNLEVQNYIILYKCIKRTTMAAQKNGLDFVVENVIFSFPSWSV